MCIPERRMAQQGGNLKRGEMTFTDEDLKRLTKNMYSLSWGDTSASDILALLARLEAAERYATCMRDRHEGWFNPEYDAWRKAVRNNDLL